MRALRPDNNDTNRAFGARALLPVLSLALAIGAVGAGCGADDLNTGDDVAGACNESDLIAQCPPGSSPLFGSASDAVCGGQGGIDIVSGTGDVTGRCVASGQCVVACQFATPCECGVSAVTRDGVFCTPCEGQAVCGNGVCEGGENPATCEADCRADCTVGQTRCSDTRTLEECNQRGRYEPIACRDYEVCDVPSAGQAVCRRADVLAGFDPAEVDETVVDVPAGRVRIGPGEYISGGERDTQPTGNTLLATESPLTCQFEAANAVLNRPAAWYCDFDGYLSSIGSGDILPVWRRGPEDGSFTMWYQGGFAVTNERGVPLSIANAEGSGEGSDPPPLDLIEVSDDLAPLIQYGSYNYRGPIITADGSTALYWSERNQEPVSEDEPLLEAVPIASLFAVDLLTGEEREVIRTGAYTPSVGGGRIAPNDDGSLIATRVRAWQGGYAINPRCNCSSYTVVRGPQLGILASDDGTVSYLPSFPADLEGGGLALSPDGSLGLQTRTATRVLVDEQTVSGGAVEIRRMDTDEVLFSILPTNNSAAFGGYFSGTKDELFVATGAGLERWNLQTRTLLSSIPNDSLGTSYAISPDGQRVAAASPTEIRLLNIADGTVLSTVQQTESFTGNQELLFDRSGQFILWSGNVQSGPTEYRLVVRTFEVQP
jgi:hypothetical protein